MISTAYVAVSYLEAEPARRRTSLLTSGHRKVWDSSSPASSVTQQDLFAQSTGWQTIDCPDADVKLLRGFLSLGECEYIFRVLRNGVQWRQDKIAVYGKTHDVPRLQQWFGTAGLKYTWSGIEMKPELWPEVLREMRIRASGATGASFNTALLNRYRNGDDTVGWHADDEPELGPAPIIGSVSLGAERDFVLRHNVSRTCVTIPLPPGSLLVMAGGTQTHWQHSLPRRKNAGERINITFRMVQPAVEGR